tara:strand:+ start:52850 stop:54241 length:1392 start_codon:yes stop_codon:yes gene_type:complete
MNAAFKLQQSGPSHFSQYGKAFQEKIFQGIITDQEWAKQMSEVMKPHFFDLKYIQYLTDRYFAYFEKYKCFPTMQLLITIIRDELNGMGADGLLREQIVEFLHRVRANPHPGDLQYVKDRTLDFCKRQAFKEALEQAVDLVGDDKFESVVELMKKAVSVGMPHSIGHDFFEDMEARFQEIVRITCPTGLDYLDTKEVLDGGLGRKELGVIVAPTGVGKSHWLVAMGAEAMRRGKNVVHYTFELSETAVGKRYDANLVGVNSNSIRENRDLIKDYYKENEDLGRLVIKEYATRTASVATLRNHIEKLKLRAFIPSLVIIDYADIMRSSKSYDSIRHELMLIYEELRQLSQDFNLPIWTASQSNRAGSGADVVGLENMSEAYGKAMVADVVVTIARKPEEKSSGFARIFVAKNRAGRDGLIFPVKIDTSMSTFTALSESEAEQYAPKQKLKEAWNSFKKEKKDTL